MHRAAAGANGTAAQHRDADSEAACRSADLASRQTQFPRSHGDLRAGIPARRLDDGGDPAHADLEISKRQELGRGECYTLLPPADDIHYVSTISDTASVSIHLLANDTACVWRHKFEPLTGVVTPFRSGYANAPCPPEA